MKINVPGKTPHERLTELTRRLLDVPKSEISSEKPQPKKKKRRR
jgi:hypothetical protein